MTGMLVGLMLIQLTQEALKIVQQKCEKTQLSVNPAKTGFVIFNRRYKLGLMKDSKYWAIEIQIAGQVEFWR